jgi:N-sulfoglucosamine sulfohydrolase
MRTHRYKYHRNIAWRLDFPFAADIYGSLSWEDVRNQVASSKEGEVGEVGGEKMIGKRKLKDYFFRPPEELYDVWADPLEVMNLAADPGHSGVLEGMRTKLEEWQRRTEDPWFYRDGVSVKFVQYHVDAGMRVPERFEFDLERPGNRARCIRVSRGVWKVGRFLWLVMVSLVRSEVGQRALMTGHQP